ncbi:MAG: type II toxin-antitoxin system PemK/MazF family toxin [Acidimicrobiales bacterium]
MVAVPEQGEIWWAEIEGMRRPVLVVTRSEAVAVLSAIVVAPVTRTVRGIPTEIPLGPHEGLSDQCAATFDNLQRIRRSALSTRLGALGARRDELCAALSALSDC